MIDIARISHLGIAVKNLDETLGFYRLLGLEPEGVEEVADQKVRVAFLPVGESRVELLESTDPEGPIARFIDKRGEGFQHLALEVDDLDQALAELAAKGVRLIDEKPRIGAGGVRIAFLHPKSTHGLLIELCEKHPE